MNIRLLFPTIAIISTLFIGFFVFLKNQNNRIDKIFCIFTISIGLWNANEYCILFADNPNIAIFIYRISHVCAILFIKYYIEFNWSLSEEIDIPIHVRHIINLLTISFSLLVLTPLIIKDITFNPYNPYIVEEHGILFSVFILYLIWAFGYALYGFIKGHKISEGVKREQYYILSYSFGFAIVAAILYILWLINPSILPYYYIFEVLYCAGIAYAIIQYQLMDIQTVIHKTIMWGTTSSLVIIPIYIFITLVRERLITLSPLSITIGISAILFLYTIYLNYIQPRIDHLFQRKKYDLQEVMKRFSNDLIALKGIEELVSKVINTIASALYIAGGSIFLYNAKTENLVRVGGIGEGMDKDMIIPEDDQFIAWLKGHNKIVEKDLIDFDPQYKEIKDLARGYFDKVKGKVSIPLVYDDKLIGIINLAEKRNLKPYSNIDIELLSGVRNEATIAIANSLLFDKVEKQNIELKKIDKLKSEMLANTSHELKTPINQIKGITEVLIDKEKAKGVGKTELEEDLTSIYESAGDLNNKVNDILESSKIASGQKIYNFEEFSLKGTADISILYNQKIVDRTNKKGKIRIYADIPEECEGAYGDQKAINTVIDNLIRNAVKFTDEGEISISAKIIERESLNRVVKGEPSTGKYIMVSVKDTGIGIDSKYHDIIFDQFRQAEGSIGRGYGGTGLGLYICKNIIEDHLGVIWVESAPGKGAVFSFLLPLSHYNVERRSVIPRRVTPDRRKIDTTKEETSIDIEEEYKAVRKGNLETILVVDDDPKNAGFVKKMLDNHGYNGICAYSGEEALELLKKNYKVTDKDNGRVRLVITDLMMPNITGYELCKRIRGSFEFRYLPIIMLTVIDEYRYNVYSYNLGADAYISKPFEKDILLSKVSLLLSNADSRNKVLSIMDISRGLTSQYELKRLLSLSVAEIKKLIHSEKITLMLVASDKDGKYLDVQISEGAVNGALINEKIRNFDCVAGYVWNNGEPLLIRDITTDERFKDMRHKGSYKTNSCILSPIIYKEEFLGIICVSDKKNKDIFTIDDLNYLTILSDNIAAAINNIHDLKKIEEQNKLIMQTKHFEFMAETVNWVGHEVNSPAQAIIANIDMLIEKDPASLAIDVYKKHLTYIEESCYRIRNICEIVSDFGKKGVKLSTLSVEKLVNSVIKYADASLFTTGTKGIKMSYKKSDGVGDIEIYGDSGMLELTIFNMIKNSCRSVRQRMGKEGIEGVINIIVSVQPSAVSDQMEEEKGERTGSKNNEYVSILIEDNGVGIDKKDIHNIFKNHFSNSPDGKGIGLFLAQKVIDAHSGTIGIESEINSFTRMDIRLPIKK